VAPFHLREGKGLILFSFFLFPAIFYCLSPEIILQASSEGIVNGSFIFFAFLFLSSLSVGRGWCGWACPGAGCQEAIFLARDNKVTRGDFIKWLIWFPWIGSVAVLAARAGGYGKVDFLHMTTHGFSIGGVQGLISYLVVLLLLIVLPAYAVGKRSFCHHLCRMAPFMITGRKIRNFGGWQSLQLQSDPELCKHCHTCADNCPMSLPVEEMAAGGRMEHAECILCGTCVDGCRQGVIRYDWGRPPTSS
jgi:polyferredoxin